MAKIEVKTSQGFDINLISVGSLFWADRYDLKSNVIRAWYTNNQYDEFTGQGFIYDAYGTPVGGNVTGYQFYYGGTQVTVNDMSVPVTSIVDYAWSNDNYGMLMDLLSGPDVFIGNQGHDIFDGYTGNDIFQGGGGNDYIRGDQGLDTAVYSGKLSEYIIDHFESDTQVQDMFGREGIDYLQSVERLAFSDAAIAFDMDGANSAGGIYRTYQAAFDRQPDTTGFGYWIDRADNGATAVQMAEEFVWSDEFQNVYGVVTSDNYLSGNPIEQVVEGFYRNVLGRTPDQSGLEFYTGVIENQDRTVGRVLAEIADSTENRENIYHSISTGMQYDLWLG